MSSVPDILTIRATRTFYTGPRDASGNRATAIAKGDERVIDDPGERGAFWTVSRWGTAFGLCRLGEEHGWKVVSRTAGQRGSSGKGPTALDYPAPAPAPQGTARSSGERPTNCRTDPRHTSAIEGRAKSDAIRRELDRTGWTTGERDRDARDSEQRDFDRWDDWP